ncbi:hypothetical protein MOO45_07900 [Bombilactobacillus folatiphilus]|uniref:HTH cro/C1-type domain-containing protein n=1 Tax=Bombilactobacillus folatiphilus TaxID=2923362 RepID=A0ABY4P931_9LACO|nr:Rgg/GadR/MutR family transcriptional regulator [Bombilactobacillus folatiphilus]UQS82094.1 hypothetical protein MOO45_07900 [Bombilactobacillus folatiphilus]
MQHIGQTIAKIQKMKNIKVTELIDGIVSRSEYYRFINGQTQLAVDVFFQLLDRLHVTLDEFQYIDNDFQRSDFFLYQDKISDLLTFKKASELHELSEEIKSKYGKDSNSKYQHLAIQAELSSDLILNETHPEKAEPLVKYFDNLEYWSQYDITLFLNCIFAFSNTSIDHFLKSLMKDINNYIYFPGEMSVVVQIHIVLCFLAIVKRLLIKLDVLDTSLNQIDLSPNQLTERVLRDFINGAVSYFHGQLKEGLNQMNKAIEIFTKYDMRRWSTRLIDMKDSVIADVPEE